MFELSDISLTKGITFISLHFIAQMSNKTLALPFLLSLLGGENYISLPNIRGTGYNLLFLVKTRAIGKLAIFNGKVRLKLDNNCG